MVVPGNGAGGDGGSGGGGDVQPERRFGSGPGARGRGGALAQTGISFGKGTRGSPEADSMVGARWRAQLGERASSSMRSCDCGRGRGRGWRALHQTAERTYLGNLHGAISHAGKRARRAQAGPRQHGRHTFAELRRCRGSG